MIEVVILIASIIASFFVGARAGWAARERAAKKFVYNYMQQAAEEAKDNVVRIIVTREGSQFFVHNESSGEFLAQGTNHKDIAGVLNSRFPDKTFIATPENLESVEYKLDDAV